MKTKVKFSREHILFLRKKKRNTAFIWFMRIFIFVVFIAQWEIFARLFGIGGRKARAWFYKFEFSMTRSGLDSWNDDDMPMPRAPVMSPLHWPEFWQAPRG